MFLYGIALFAVFGIFSVSADSHCGMDRKTMVNQNVTDLIAMMNTTVLNNDTVPNEQKDQAVLNAVCNNPMVRAEVNKIEQVLGDCPAFVNTTDVKDLTLGALTFLDLFENFQSVDNFCDCVPALHQAMAVKMLKDQLMHTMANAKYPLIDVNFLCSTEAVKTAVMTIAEKVQTCPGVLGYAEILNADNVKLMDKFRREQCSRFMNDKFECAKNKSTAQMFKTCIMDAEKSGDADEKRCGRNACVTNSTQDCGDGGKWYMMAVNMDKATMQPFQLDMSKCDTSGVAAILAPFSLLFLSVLAFMFF